MQEALLPLLKDIQFFKERDNIKEEDFTEIGQCLTYETVKRGNNVFEWDNSLVKAIRKRLTVLSKRKSLKCLEKWAKRENKKNLLLFFSLRQRHHWRTTTFILPKIAREKQNSSKFRKTHHLNRCTVKPLNFQMT